MIYIDTRRPFWNPGNTIPRFFGAAFLLGTSALALSLNALAFFRSVDGSGSGGTAQLVATLIRIALFAWEGTTIGRLLSDSTGINYRSGLLLWRKHQGLLWLHVALFTVATISGILALRTDGGSSLTMAGISFGAIFGSALIERYFFFVAAVAPKMPGGVAT